MLRTLLLIGLAAALALPQAAIASHMQSYTRLPEHDDLGRSDEPDLASTTVLGTPLVNRVIDLTNTDTAVALPDPVLPTLTPIAPGCSDDAGRQLSGKCWLYMQTGVGTQGMSGNRAPGFMGTKNGVLRFLDMREDVQVSAGAVRVLDVNHKLQDNGVSALLANNVGDGAGGRFVAGPTTLWAWFGIWQDRNGNGVIDHEQNPGEAGSVSARNEFLWMGGCLSAAHVHTTIAACHEIPDARMAGFVWPGNHHARCGGLTVLGVDPVVGCSTMPADVPGLQAYCLLQEGAAEQLPEGTDGAMDLVVVHACGSNPEALDQDAGQSYGDPLLENPAIALPDFYFDDRSGEPDIEARQWFADQGQPMYFYDGSLLSTLIFVDVEGAPFAASYTGIDLTRAHYVDVDIDRAWSPATDALLNTVLKPTLRTAWVTSLREQTVATMNTVSSVPRGQATDLSPTLGPVVGSVADPGYAHEPNDPLDRYPAAVYQAAGPRTHEGFTNDYSGYALQPRGWLDAQPVRIMTDNVAWQLPEPSGDVLSQCLVCNGGPGLTSATSILNGPRAAGDDQRGLDPGVWDWVGHVGLWYDRAQRWIEESVGVDTGGLSFHFVPFTAPPDGWVGNVVNATGAYLYRGYANETCSVHGPAALHYYAWCHPTKDGMLDDPSDYGAASLEWSGQCVSGQNVESVTLVPRGNAWTVPVLVWRNFETDPPTQTTDIEDWTGRADDPGTPQNEAALTLHLACKDVLAGTFRGADFLILPEGNMGLDITATTQGSVQRLDGVRDAITDVDQLPGWPTP